MKKFVFKLTRKLLATGAVLAALAAGTPLHAMYIPGAVQHLGTSDCELCHVAGMNVTAQDAKMLSTSQEALCGGQCHPTSVQVSHPSGFKPLTPPPLQYPLDWQGNLTCSTCHDIHSNDIGLIRGAVIGKDFCQACHAASFFTSMRDGGTSLMGGHLSAGIDTTGSTLDAYSLRCIECHGASVTPWLTSAISGSPFVSSVNPAANHTIGKVYQDAVAFGGYRPRLAVENKLLLPAGNVSCVSCHLGYQSTHGKLAIINLKSALCNECHDI